MRPEAICQVLLGPSSPHCCDAQPSDGGANPGSPQGKARTGAHWREIVDDGATLRHAFKDTDGTGSLLSRLEDRRDIPAPPDA
jgi:hypothetical protein